MLLMEVANEITLKGILGHNPRSGDNKGHFKSKLFDNISNSLFTSHLRGGFAIINASLVLWKDKTISTN